MSREYSERAIHRWYKVWSLLNDRMLKGRDLPKKESSAAIQEWVGQMMLLSSCAKFLELRKTGAPDFACAVWARPFSDVAFLVEACAMFDEAERKLAEAG